VENRKREEGKEKETGSYSELFKHFRTISLILVISRYNTEKIAMPIKKNSFFKISG